MTDSKNWCKGFCRSCGTGCGEYCQQIHELNNEVQEQARLNGMGSEREAKLMARVEELHRALGRVLNSQVLLDAPYAGYSEAISEARDLFDSIKSIKEPRPAGHSDGESRDTEAGELGSLPEARRKSEVERSEPASDFKELAEHLLIALKDACKRVEEHEPGYLKGASPHARNIADAESVLGEPVYISGGGIVWLSPKETK